MFVCLCVCVLLVCCVCVACVFVCVFVCVCEVVKEKGKLLTTFLNLEWNVEIKLSCKSFLTTSKIFLFSNLSSKLVMLCV